MEKSLKHDLSIHVTQCIYGTLSTGWKAPTFTGHYDITCCSFDAHDTPHET